MDNAQNNGEPPVDLFEYAVDLQEHFVVSGHTDWEAKRAKEEQFLEDVRKMAKQNLEQGCSAKDTFLLVLREVINGEIHDVDLSRMFHILSTEPHFYWLKTRIPEEWRFSLGVISEEAEKLKSAIAIWTKDHYKKIKFLDSRYALTFTHGSKRRMFLLDNFHGQRREIQVDGEFPADKARFIDTIHIIDSNYLMFNEWIGQDDFSFTHLLQLDLVNLKAKLVSTMQLEEKGPNIIFDTKCRRKFLICSCVRDILSYQYACVENDQLILDPLTIRIDQHFYYPKLESDKLRVFRIKPSEEDEKYIKTLEYGEFVLTPGVDNPLFSYLFDVKIACKLEKYDLPFKNVQISPTAWYLCDDSNFGLELISFYLLDLQERRLELSKFFFYLDARIVDLFVDEHEIATVCIKNTNLDEFVVHRFPFRNPDTLLHQALFKIRRHSMTYQSNLYNELLPKLPENLRPFENVPVNYIRSTYMGN